MKTDLPTASFGSSQAPTDAVDKSPSASNTKIQTAPARLQQMPHMIRAFFMAPSVADILDC